MWTINKLSFSTQNGEETEPHLIFEGSSHTEYKKLLKRRALNEALDLLDFSFIISPGIL